MAARKCFSGGGCDGRGTRDSVGGGILAVICMAAGWLYSLRETALLGPRVHSSVYILPLEQDVYLNVRHSLCPGGEAT